MMDMGLFSLLVIGKGPTPARAWESGSPGARLRAVCDLDGFRFVGEERPGRRASGRRRRLLAFLRSCVGAGSEACASSDFHGRSCQLKVLYPKTLCF